MSDQEGRRGIFSCGTRLAVMWWRVVRVGYLRFSYGGGVLDSAGVAFYALLCVGPIGIIVGAIVQLVLGSSGEAYRWLTRTLEDFDGPAAQQIMPQVDRLLSNPHAYLAGGLSILTLLWAGSRLFEALERSLSAVWPGTDFRGYTQRKLLSVLTMTVGCLLLAGLALGEALVAQTWGWLGRSSQMVGFGPLPTIMRLAAPVHLGLSLVAFFLMYRFLPVQRVSNRPAAVGAIWAAVMWQVGSAGLASLITGSQRRESIWGGLVEVVVFSLWALLWAQVLVLGGHLAVAYEHVFILRRPREVDDGLAKVPGVPSA